MRNDLTVELGNSLTSSFNKSGMSAQEFLQYLEGTRHIFDVRKESLQFFTQIGAEIGHFYFADDQRWHCKF